MSEYSDEERRLNGLKKRIWFTYFLQVSLLREPFLIFGQFGSLMTGIYLMADHQITPGNLVIALSWQ